MRQFKLTIQILFYVGLAFNIFYFATRKESFWPANSIYFAVAAVLVPYFLKMFYLYKAKEVKELKQHFWVLALLTVMYLTSYLSA